MPEKKSTNKTPEQRYADIKRKIERLNQNPEANKTEIDRLMEQAGRLLDEIEKTEKTEFLRMEERDRQEAEKMRTELEPLVREAEEIEARLEQLIREEAEQDEIIARLSIQEHTPTLDLAHTPEAHSTPEDVFAEITLEDFMAALQRGPDTHRETSSPTEPDETPTEEIQAPDTGKERKLTQEAIVFFEEFGVLDALPEGFAALNEIQQTKVIRDLKQRILDVVAQDARTQYSRALRQRLDIPTASEEAGHILLKKILRVGIRIKSNLTKEKEVKNTEHRIFEEIKQSAAGRAFLTENLRTLTEITKNQDLILSTDGALVIDYGKELGLGEDNKDTVLQYNIAAHQFRNMPYEWGLEPEGSTHQKAYEEAKRAYEHVVADILDIKRYRPGGDAQAMKDMLKMQNALTLEQLINTHPEIDIAFGRLGEGAGKEEFWATVKRLAGVDNTQNAALFAGGYAARTATKAVLGALAMPIVGAVFGYLKAQKRAEEELREKNKNARYGTENTHQGARNMQGVESQDTKGRETGLHAKLENLITEIETKKTKGEDVSLLITRLSSRIKYTQEKMQAGLVNFGSQSDALKNQYLLINALNQAIVLTQTEDLAIKNELDRRLETILSLRAEKITESQKEFIKDKALEGAIRGAGVATAGYMLRAAGEEMGWWGEKEYSDRTINETSPAMQPQEQQSVYIDTESKEAPVDTTTVQQPTSETTPDTATVVATPREGETVVDSTEQSTPRRSDSTNIATKQQTPDTVSTEAEVATTPKTDDTAHTNTKPKLVHVNETPKVSVKKSPSIETTRDLVHNEAVVGKGEGVTYAFKQQIKADPTIAKQLAKQIGYEGRVGTQAFYKALGEKFGYINEKGEWIGVKGSGEDTAYQFEKQGDTYVVVEYHKEGSRWVRGETHTDEGKFEGKDFDKKYEYFGATKKTVDAVDKIENKSDQLTRPQTPEETENGQLARAEKIKKINDTDNGQLARAPKETISRKVEGEAGNPEWSVYDTPSTPTREAELYGDKKDIEWGVAPGPDGAPWIVEDFTLDGGKAIRLFADRFGYDQLSNAEVNYVGETYRYNLNRIFTQSEDWTNRLSMMSAPKLLRMNLGEEITSDKEELSMYIKMLNQETGLKPFNDGWLGNKETAKDYVLRMLLDLEHKGKLDTFNRKFDQFIEGR